MNLKKKLSALVLVFILVFTTLAVPVFAEEGTFTITFTQPTGAIVSFSPAGVDSFVEGIHTYTFQNGEQVEMTVTAESGYKLASIRANGVSLPGANGQTTFVYSEKIDSNTTLAITTAQLQTAPITVNTGNFTTTFDGADNSAMTAVFGASVTLQITPNEGFTVSKIVYNGTEVTPGNAYTFTVGETNAFEITVDGAAIVYAALNIAVTGDGSVSPGNGSYPVGTSVELTFSAGASYTLSSVVINGVPVALEQISGNKYTLIILEDTTVSVEYKKSCTITTTVGTGGTISINGKSVSGASTVKVAEGVAVIIIVSPGLGYKISSVKVDNNVVLLDAENRYIISSVSTSVKVQVTFEATTETQYNIIASAGAGGIITPSGNQNPVEPGKNKTFTVYPNTGYEVDTVTVDGQAVSITNNTYTFEGVISDHTINVTFKVASTTAPIGVDDIDWTSAGTITIDISKQTKVSAEVFQKIIAECADKKIVFQSTSFKWIIPQGATITTALTSAELAVTISNGSANSTITALIKSKVESLDFKLVSYGKNITFPNGTELSVYLGDGYKNRDLQELIYSASDNKLINPINASGTSEVTLLTASSDGWVTLLYNNDSDIILCEKLDGYYKIAASATAGGTINQSGNIVVETGGEVSFDVKANEGYVISSLKVDGVEVEDALGQTAYTYSGFKNISQDHTIAAEFQILADYEASTEGSGSHSALIVSLIIVFIALAGGATLFIIKWRQEKY